METRNERTKTQKRGTKENATMVKRYYKYVLKRPGYEPKPTVLYEKINEQTKLLMERRK